MSVTIHNDDSDKAIREALRKVMEKKEKKGISLDKYFGKVSFGTDGLSYQKKVRNEW